MCVLCRPRKSVLCHTTYRKNFIWRKREKKCLEAVDPLCHVDLTWELWGKGMQSRLGWTVKGVPVPIRHRLFPSKCAADGWKGEHRTGTYGSSVIRMQSYTYLQRQLYNLKILKTLHFIFIIYHIYSIYFSYKCIDTYTLITSTVQISYSFGSCVYAWLSTWPSEIY